MNDERPTIRHSIRRAISSISPKIFKVIAVVVVVVLAAIVILAVTLYLLLRPPAGKDGGSKDDDSDDPDTPLPPSSSPLKVFSRAAVVSLGKPCSGFGKEILLKGGSAADAAIATMLCVGACVMQSMGLGGGFILTMYDRKTKAAHCLIARETAPAAATKDMFHNRSLTFGPQAAGVPGALKGYQELHKKFGKLPWKDLFQPTIELCEKGITVDKRLAINFGYVAKSIENSPTFMNSILKDLKRIPKEGDIVKLPELAKTLRTVADSPDKADAFYKGELTKPFVQDIQEFGGIITEEDLNKYEVSWEDTINVTFPGGQTVHTSAMPGAGILLGFLLRIMDGVVQRLSSPAEHSQFLVEAFKHAYGHRPYLCDPHFTDKTSVEQVIKRLSDEDYVGKVREKIKPFWTTSDVDYYRDAGPTDESGTDHIVVMDAEGSAVSVTSSINYWFGCVFVSKSTGIIMNNHMADFSSPSNTKMVHNYIEPGKRPVSSMCPTVVVDSEGDAQLVVGAAGGTSIVYAVAQVMQSYMFLGKDIKESIDEPRYYSEVSPNKINYEYGVTKDVVRSWKKTGYAVERVGEYIAVVTGIARRGKELTANCDRRKFGSVEGY